MGSLLLFLTFYCIIFVCLWILHHLSFFPYLPFTLHKQKQTTKRTNYTKINLAFEAAVCHRVFYPNMFSCNCILIAVSHWSGSMSLTFAILSILDLHWDFYGLSCCFPVSWRLCKIGSTGFTLSWLLAVQDRVDVGCANSNPWIWAWVVAELFTSLGPCDHIFKRTQWVLWNYHLPLEREVSN